MPETHIIFCCGILVEHEAPGTKIHRSIRSLHEV